MLINSQSSFGTEGSSRPVFTGPKGFGMRHFDDHAPFHLWDEARHVFRKMAMDEVSWIVKSFSTDSSRVSEVLTNGPFIFVRMSGALPPSPPLTIGGAVARFIVDGDRGCDQLCLLTTDYANPRLPDPVPLTSVKPYTTPSAQQVEAVVNAMAQLADVEIVAFYCYSLIVQLRWNERSYSRHSLPGIVGGRSVIYHHAAEPYWPNVKFSGQPGLMKPDGDTNTQELGNYKGSGRRLCPGVRGSSRLMSSSADILAGNGSGERYLTGANHAFPEVSTAYHPSPSDQRIGHVIHRDARLDIASTELKSGTWVTVDSMATGLVHFQCLGERYFVPPYSQGETLQLLSMVEEKILYCRAP